MPYITHLATAVPAYNYSQEDLIDYFKARVSETSLQKKINLIFRRGGVKERYSVLPDFKTSNPILFSEENHYTAAVEKRLCIFRTEAVHLIEKALADLPPTILDGLTDLITVSCTGLEAPGLEIQLVEHLALKPTIRLHTVNFRGCYGGLVALRTAELICKANPEARVLIADVELSTLHFQVPQTDDDIITSSLFSDGAAVALVTGARPQMPALAITATASRLILNGKTDMSWQIRAAGFKMQLSNYVPALLEADLKANFKNLFKTPIKINSLNWAIHPGGPKILDRFAVSVGIERKELADSFGILEFYGNMSSATIFFILKSSFARYICEAKPIFAAAFGPGLTMEAALLKPIF